jgi:hypothetical protein
MAKARGTESRVLQGLLHSTEAKVADCVVQPSVGTASAADAQDAPHSENSASYAEWLAPYPKYAFKILA